MPHRAAEGSQESPAASHERDRIPQEARSSVGWYPEDSCDSDRPRFQRLRRCAWHCCGFPAEPKASASNIKSRRTCAVTDVTKRDKTVHAWHMAVKVPGGPNNPSSGFRAKRAEEQLLYHKRLGAVWCARYSAVDCRLAIRGISVCVRILVS
jgi:hypothetical protein